GDDLNATIWTFAAALGANAGEILERLVNDATIARAHRIERDHLAFFGNAIAQALGHLCELIFVARAVPFGIDRHVLSRLARFVRDARRQILNRLEHDAALSDDAPRIRSFDLDANLVFAFFALAVVGSDVDLAGHRHLLHQRPNEFERALRLRVE